MIKSKTIEKFQEGAALGMIIPIFIGMFLMFISPFIFVGSIIYYPPLALIMNSYLIYWKISDIIYVQTKFKYVIKEDQKEWEENGRQKELIAALPSLIGAILLQIYLLYRVFIMKKVEPKDND
jgi:hypothetical protein